MNWIAVVVSALTTLVTGFIWYSPQLFGNTWMRETGLTEEQLKKGNMLKIFGFTFFFSFLMTMVVHGLVIHQSGALGMIGGPYEVKNALPSYAAFMTDYGMAFRTFKHGALHGFMTGLFFVFPIMGINGLFEHKSWKYIFITSGYWILTLTIMGAILCGWV